jgi:hypothetical protein
VLGRLANGLVLYGILGVAIAAAGLLGSVWLWGRVGSVTDRTTTQVTTIVATMDQAAAAVRDASASATSFAGTLERTEPAVRQVAAAIGDLRGDLRSVEAELRQVNILGSRPFGTVADQFGRMAADLEGLDERLAGIATDLTINRGSLVTNADSLAALGERLSAISTDVETRTIDEGLAEAPMLVTVVALLLVAWIALPAIGALWIGVSLRRALSRRRR